MVLNLLPTDLLKRSKSFSNRDRRILNSFNRDLSLSFLSLKQTFSKILNRENNITINVKNGQISEEYEDSLLDTMKKIGIDDLVSSTLSTCESVVVLEAIDEHRHNLIFHLTMLLESLIDDNIKKQQHSETNLVNKNLNAPQLVDLAFPPNKNTKALKLLEMGQNFTPCRKLNAYSGKKCFMEGLSNICLLYTSDAADE